jgi:DNA-binding response OmpR family regulator
LPPRTGDLIVARGLASLELVEAAHKESRARGEPIASRLLALGIEEGELASVLAERHGVPGVDLSHCAVPLDALDLVPRAVAEGDLILPLSLDGGRIHLAMAHPWDDRVIAEVRFVTGKEVSPYSAVHTALLRAIAEAYEERGRGGGLWRGRACAAGAPHLAAVLPGPGAIPGPDEPLAAAAGEALIPDAEILIEVEPAEVTAPIARQAPLVLVVDDEPEIRQLVERLLGSKGYQTAVAVDGQEALDLADELVPDLVLLDAMLPKVHGFEACRRIKASPRTRHVPVVMMTAIYRGWRFAQDARDSYGASDYVEKPFRMDDLLLRIEKALREAAAPPAPPTPAELEAHSAVVARGKELLAGGKISDAIAVLADAVKRDPLSAEAQYHLGRALHASGDAFGAMTALEHAVEAAPGNLAALRALAGLYEEAGFRRKAAEVLERALAVVPDGAGRSALRKDLMRLIAS